MSRAPDDTGPSPIGTPSSAASAGLPPEQRSVLVLQHYAGLSQAEIADVLGIPLGTAGSRIHYAARALRAAIESDSRLGSGRESNA